MSLDHHNIALLTICFRCLPRRLPRPLSTPLTGVWTISSLQRGMLKTFELQAFSPLSPPEHYMMIFYQWESLLENHAENTIFIFFFSDMLSLQTIFVIYLARHSRLTEMRQ